MSLNPDSIHKAVVDSAWQKKESLSVTLSTKVTEETSALADQILSRNNSSVSAFLRQCLINLIEEYKPSNRG